MPRHTDKYPRTNPNKMMTRAAAAAAAATINTSTEDLSTNNRPSTSATGSSTTADDQCPPRPEPPASPAKCAICLGDLANRCYTNSCIHQFCFGCLLEWSKIKAECPLCKSNFQSIYHNIRNNDDYDEYHIPHPASIVPHLSIRLTTEGFRAQLPQFRYDDPIPHAHALQLGVMGHSASPFHDHGYSFQRMVRERERERRQHQNSYIRILEMGPFSEPRAIDFMNYNSGTAGRSVLDNPFYTDEPELFGSVDDNANTIATDTSLRGYQNRKRIYDRLQFVQPFASTLPAGTVFFPSVEYFQTHRSALARVSGWLYREIMALMGIHRSRNEMGYVFDVILSILPRFDIRSRDFREMITTHFGARTRHFQHEFYHFLISGMLMEEYDRVAQYTAPSSAPNNNSTASSSATSSTTTTATRPSRSTNTPATTSTSTSTSNAAAEASGTTRIATPMPASPIVVTIDSSSSSSSDSDSDSSIETVDAGESSSAREPRQMRRVYLPDMPNSDSNSRRDRLVPDSPIVLQTIPSPSPPPACRLNLHHNLFRPETERSGHFRQAYESQMLQSERERRHRREPTAARVALADISPSGRRFPWDINRQPPRAHSNGLVPPPGAVTSIYDPPSRTSTLLDDWESALESLNRFRPVPHRTDPSMDRFISQTLDGHRYTSQNRGEEALREVPENSPTTATRTTDFERPRCPVETGYPSSSSLVDSSRPERYSNTARRHNQLMYICGQDAQIPLDAHRGIPGTPGYVRRVSSHADPVTNMNLDGSPGGSLEYNYDTGTLRTIDSPAPSSFVPESLKSLKGSRAIKTSPPPPPPAVPDADDDEIEMLGIHPIVKPPPLAIITLSSDDEDDNPKSKTKVEKSEPIITLNSPSTSTSTSTSAATAAAASSSAHEVSVVGATSGVSSAATATWGIDPIPGWEDVMFAPAELIEHEESPAPEIESWTPRPLDKGSRFGITLSRKREISSKHRKNKNKKIKTSPEFIDVTSSSENESSTWSVTSSSDDEVYVESVKLKNKKGKNSFTQLDSIPKKKKHHRKHKKSPAERMSLTASHHKPKSPLNLLNTLTMRTSPPSSFLPMGTKTQRVVWSDSDSESVPRMKNISSLPQRYSQRSSAFWGSNPSSASPSAAAASMPSTMPGIGILDLRKLMEEKKRDKNKGNGERPRVATMHIRPNCSTEVRWESEGSEADREVNVNGATTGSDSDWAKSKNLLPAKAREQSGSSSLSSSDDDNEADGIMVESDDDSSSSDTQCNSRENHRNAGSNSSRGSFFIPNLPQSTPRPLLSRSLSIELPREDNEAERTLDLRMTDPDPLLPWHDDPIVGHFGGMGDGSADLLDLSLGSLQATTPPPSLFEVDLSRSSSRRDSIDENTALNGRSTSDWLGESDCSYKWGRGYK